jgi:hypothetical protein
MIPLSPKRLDIISLRWSFVIRSLFYIWSVTLSLICFEHKSLVAFGKTLSIAFVSPPSSSLPIRMSMHCTLLSKRAFTCEKNVLYVKYDASTEWCNICWKLSHNLMKWNKFWTNLTDDGHKIMQHMYTFHKWHRRRTQSDAICWEQYFTYINPEPMGEATDITWAGLANAIQNKRNW